MLALLERHYDDGTTYRRMRTKCVHYLNAYYKVCDASGMYLTSEQHDTCFDAVEKCLVFYGALARNAAYDKKFKWITVNKHHFWFHVAQYSKYMNPRWLWCYQAEDFMRHIVRVCAAIMIGSNMMSSR